MGFKLVAVAAIADNGVIGAQGQVPWKVGSDMRHFRHLTMSKPVLMGRKTWESLKQPLVGRDNIILTTNADYTADGGHVMTALDEALKIAKEFATMRGTDEIIIAGGSNLYAQTLPDTDILHVTEIHISPPGDAYFPDFDKKDWHEVSREKQKPGRKDECDFSFVTYEKIAKG